jgi:fibronectin type 3 domain-containing protein
MKSLSIYAFLVFVFITPAFSAEIGERFNIKTMNETFDVGSRLEVNIISNQEFSIFSGKEIKLGLKVKSHSLVPFFHWECPKGSFREVRSGYKHESVIWVAPKVTKPTGFVIHATMTDGVIGGEVKDKVVILVEPESSSTVKYGANTGNELSLNESLKVALRTSSWGGDPWSNDNQQVEVNSGDKVMLLTVDNSSSLDSKLHWEAVAEHQSLKGSFEAGVFHGQIYWNAPTVFEDTSVTVSVRVSSTVEGISPDGSLTFIVKPMVGAINSDKSPPSILMNLPLPNSTVSTSELLYNSLRIADNEGLSELRIYYKKTGDDEIMHKSVSLSKRSSLHTGYDFQDMDLDPGEYTFRYTVTDLAGNESSAQVTGVTILKNSASNYPPSDAPDVLKNFNANTTGSYLIQWVSIENASSYLLQQANDLSFSLNLKEYTLTENSKLFTEQPNGTYYYRVKAMNDYGDSGFGFWKSFSISRDEAPNFDGVGVTPKDGATNVDLNPMLLWDVIDDHTVKSTLLLSGVPITTSGGQLEAEDLTATSYQAGPLKKGKTYYWRILAEDESGHAVWSPMWKFTTSSDGEDPMVQSVTLDGASAEYAPGDRISFSYTVVNSGQVSTSQDIQLVHYLVRGTNGGETKIGEKFISSGIAPGTTISVSGNTIIPISFNENSRLRIEINNPGDDVNFDNNYAEADVVIALGLPPIPTVEHSTGTLFSGKYNEFNIQWGSNESDLKLEIKYDDGIYQEIYSRSHQDFSNGLDNSSPPNSIFIPSTKVGASMWIKFTLTNENGGSVFKETGPLNIVADIDPHLEFLTPNVGELVAQNQEISFSISASEVADWKQVVLKGTIDGGEYSKLISSNSYSITDNLFTYTPNDILNTAWIEVTIISSSGTKKIVESKKFSVIDTFELPLGFSTRSTVISSDVTHPASLLDIAVGSDGTPHIIYNIYENESYALKYAYITEGVWYHNTIDTNTRNFSAYAQKDTDGNVVVVYFSNTSPSNERQFKSLVLSNGSYSSPILIDSGVYARLTKSESGELYYFDAYLNSNNIYKNRMRDYTGGIFASSQEIDSTSWFYMSNQIGVSYSGEMYIGRSTGEVDYYSSKSAQPVLYGSTNNNELSLNMSWFNGKAVFADSENVHFYSGPNLYTSTPFQDPMISGDLVTISSAQVCYAAIYNGTYTSGDLIHYPALVFSDNQNVSIPYYLSQTLASEVRADMTSNTICVAWEEPSSYSIYYTSGDVTEDLVPPSLIWQSTPDGSYDTADSITMSWSSDDGVGVISHDVYYQHTDSNVDTLIASLSGEVSNYNWIPETEGRYTIKIVAKDSVGNYKTIRSPEITYGTPPDTALVVGDPVMFTTTHDSQSYYIGDTVSIGWTVDAPSNVMQSIVEYSTNGTDYLELGRASGLTFSLVWEPVSTVSSSTLRITVAYTDGSISTVENGPFSVVDRSVELSIPKFPSPVFGSEIANGIAIEWQMLSAPQGTLYDVYLDTSSTLATKFAGDISSTKVTLSGLQSDATYFMKVVAKSGSIERESDMWVYQTPEVLISNPSNLSASENNAGSVALTWEDQGDASQYNIERKVVGDSAFSVLATSVDLSFEDQSVLPEMTYIYRVNASLAGVVSSYSDTVVVMTGRVIQAPHSPFPYVGQNDVSSSISLQWRSELDQATYQVKIFESGSWVDYDAGTSANLGLTDLDFGTMYPWKVIATDDLGNILTSDEWHFITQLEAVPSPPTLNMTENGSVLSLNWNQQVLATSYTVEVAIDDASFTSLLTTGENSTLYSIPEDVDRVRFHVISTNDIGIGDPSNSVTWVRPVNQANHFAEPLSSGEMAKINLFVSRNGSLIEPGGEIAIFDSLGRIIGRETIAYDGYVGVDIALDNSATSVVEGARDGEPISMVYYHPEDDSSHRLVLISTGEKAPLIFSRGFSGGYSVEVAPNQVPSLQLILSADQIKVGGEVEIKIIANDPDDDQLFASLQIAGVPVEITGTGGMFTFTYKTVAASVLQIRGTVFDGISSTSISRQLTIDNIANTPPTLDLESSSLVINSGETVTFTLLSSDADGDSVTNSLSINGEEVLLSSVSGKDTYSYEPTKLGEVTVVATASDGRESTVKVLKIQVSDENDALMTFQTVDVIRSGAVVTFELLVASSVARVGAYELAIEYDPAILEPVVHELAALAGTSSFGNPLGVNAGFPGRLDINGFSLAGESGLEISLLKIPFTIQSGTTQKFSIGITGLLYSPSTDQIPFVFQSEIFQLAEDEVSYILGDATGDGVVNIVDAMVIAQYAVRLRTKEEVVGFSVSDINKDGKINIVDAMMVAQRAVRLRDENFEMK